MEQTESHKRNVSRFTLFLAFSRISLSSFGGAIFWARRELVERQHWLTADFSRCTRSANCCPAPTCST